MLRWHRFVRVQECEMSNVGPSKKDKEMEWWVRLNREEANVENRRCGSVQSTTFFSFVLQHTTDVNQLSERYIHTRKITTIHNAYYNPSFNFAAGFY